MCARTSTRAHACVHMRELCYVSIQRAACMHVINARYVHMCAVCVRMCAWGMCVCVCVPVINVGYGHVCAVCVCMCAHACMDICFAYGCGLWAPACLVCVCVCVCVCNCGMCACMAGPELGVSTPQLKAVEL